MVEEARKVRQRRYGGRVTVSALGAALVAVGLVPPFVSSATAAPPSQVSLHSAFQAGSQILVRMSDAWVRTDAPAVAPAISNYEYTTDNGATWLAFDPPITTPVYNSVAGQAPYVGICEASDTQLPLVPGTGYQVALRAVNADGTGAWSAPKSVTFTSFAFYEMNPCGGTWGGQDLKVMTGRTNGYWFNTFGVYRGGLQQIYRGKDAPGKYCFYMFAQATKVGCPEVSFTLASSVANADWDSWDPPVRTYSGNTWTIEQTAHKTLNGSYEYSLVTTLTYTSPNAYVDVHHELTTPNVSALTKTPTGTASGASTALTVGDGTGIVVGMCVSGTGIASGTVVKAISGTSVTLDRATTGAVSGAVSFTACAKIYHSSDMYLDGSDDGPGDSQVIGGNRLVAQVTDPGAIDPDLGVNGGVGGIMEVNGHPFTSWVEGYYGCMRGEANGDCTTAAGYAFNSPWGVNYGGSWPNGVDADPSQDAGTAAEWSVNPIGTAGPHEVRTWIFFASASPSLSGGFTETEANVGDTTNLVVNVNNAPNWTWNAAQFDLALPGGTTPGTPVSTCGGTASVVAGILQLRGGALTPSTGLSCTISVPLTLTTPGTKSVTNAEVSQNLITSTGRSPAVQELTPSVSGLIDVEVDPDPTPTPTPSTTARPPIQEPPGLPTDVAAVPGNSQAVVSWTAPWYPGSQQVIGYRATASPGGQSCEVRVPPTSPPTPLATTCTVTGLTNGTAYTFTVQAYNAVGGYSGGWGLPSAPSAPVIPGAAPAPSPSPTPTPSPTPSPSPSPSPVPAPAVSIQITGSRDGGRVSVTGSTSGLSAGSRVTAHYRVAASGEFRPGSSVGVGQTGNFSWGRKLSPRKSLWVYFTAGDATSAVVELAASSR